LGNVAREAEVGILVNRTWDEGRNVRFRAEDLREGIGKGWRCLNGAKMYLANVITDRKDGPSRKKDGGERETTYESPKPNVAFAWLRVIWREIFDTFL
jgi:hypothetical protein